jgi:ornithine cyclodeaminase
MPVPFLSAADVARAITRAGAAQAITDTLRAGLDPAEDAPREIVDLANGQLLLMPSETSTAVGLKAAAVAPGNPERGHPRVQATYLLLDRDTLALTALVDGIALTDLRTPAVSMAALLPVVDRLPAPASVLVLGAGPQGTGHVAALAECPGLELGRVVYVVRDVERARSALPPGTEVIAHADVAAAVRAADVIVCATTARTPLFDAADVRDEAVVLAVGTHEPDARELDGALLGRSTVVVEDVAAALREAGDVVLAIEEGHLGVDRLVPLADLVTDRTRPDPGRPVVFKSTGMSWEDLAVAEALVRGHQSRGSA